MKEEEEEKKEKGAANRNGAPGDAPFVKPVGKICYAAVWPKAAFTRAC